MVMQPLSASELQDSSEEDTSFEQLKIRCCLEKISNKLSRKARVLGVRSQECGPKSAVPGVRSQDCSPETAGCGIAGTCYSSLDWNRGAQYVTRLAGAHDRTEYI
ncbi:hypothetical protein NQZ68_035640 [Dissostichus eleginoides]|nr:hypothetical protein NQZ68_035640 [Dissostichus eleginoides]